MAGRPLRQLGGQLDPLGLAARQGRRRLAEADVAEADVDQRLHVAGDGGLVGEELQRLLARQVEHLGDVLALERDVEGVAVVAGALAHLARDVDVGQEVHLDLDRAVAGARLAAAALDVEREPPGQVAADLGLLGLGEQLADVVEHAGVGGGVRPRGAPDGRLVDADDLVELLDALDALVAARRHLGPVDLLHQRPQQDVVDEGRLARARHAGDGDEARRAGCRRRCPARLCSRAPLTESQPSPGSRRCSGTGIDRVPGQVLAGERRLVLAAAACTVPEWTIAPPCSPAPGPMSTTWSATAMVSSSCSTTMTVLPSSRRRISVSISRRLSRWCSPIDGSSSTYSTPTRPEPIWLARRMRWASPPARVAVPRDERQVVEADVEQEPQPGVDLLEHRLGDHAVALGQLERRRATAGGLADRHRRQLGDVAPADRDRQVNGLSRAPSHAGHGTSRM